MGDLPASAHTVIVGEMRLFKPGRVGFLIVLLAFGLSAISCGEAREGTEPGGMTSADATPTPEPTLVRDFLISVQEQVSIVFVWHDSNVAGTGAFIWRQAEGVRRWDILPRGLANPSSGEILLEFGVDLTRPRGTSYVGCLWTRTGQSARLECSEGSTPGRAQELYEALSSPLIGSATDSTVAGYRVTCSAFEGPRVRGEYCYDSEFQLPLKLQIDGAQDLTATSVSRAVNHLLLPIELIRDPESGDHRIDAVVDIADLDLPSYVTFDD